MNITRLKIHNFRSIIEQEIFVQKFSLFIGANNAGKSTIMNAIRLFYSDFNWSIEDFPKTGAHDEEVWIEIEFNLSDIEWESLADYNLQIDHTNPFKVPALSRSSCYLTKLLANADRYANSPYKDIFDILAMFSHWGEIPNDAWDEADTHYGKALVFKNLKKSCEHINAHASEYLEIATNQLDINPAYAEHLLQVTNQEFLNYLNNLEKTLLNTSPPRRTFL